MAESAEQACIVLTTTDSVEKAEQLAHTLVEERLIACATVFPSAKSIYLWQGRVESATEAIVLMKTVHGKLPPLETRLHALHSYETPEFLVVRMESASAAYLNWLVSSVKGL